MRHHLTLLLVPLALALSCSKAVAPEQPVDLVDTSIGTGGHGHVFVGANVPFGMVQLGPTSIITAWDWCSGYHESDSTVLGFAHTHLEGTGIGDLNDIYVMPVVGRDITYAKGVPEDQNSGIWSYADRSKEVSVPGYYSVPLERYGVTAEMTATARVGLHRYSFPADASDAAIVFDLEDHIDWDAPTDYEITVLGDNAIEGYRFSTGWAKDQRVWFRAEFSKPFDSVETPEKGFWRFNFSNPGTVMLKVALSPVSTEGAAGNLTEELPGWDFEAVKAAAREKWNSELGKIKVESSDREARVKFYTALYHTMICPSLFSDCGQEDKYTTFSLWDTYRAQMPLMTIIHPDLEDAIINSFLEQFDRQGYLPVWHLWGNETDCMCGNPGISVTADAILKGFNGFDTDKAYQAMLASTDFPSRGQDIRNKYGFIPADLFNQAVAHDMEYAIADWALAQVALKRGDTANYEKFLSKSHSYRNYFDPKTGFLRGRKTNGKFTEPFSPYFSNHFTADYMEGNGWQYLWLVPHDLKGLEQCYEQLAPNGRTYGGRNSKKALITKLDSLFTVSSEIKGEDASPDISGLIGQYAHGNEPSHHVVYFYNMLGQPWKTADLVRYICKELYTTTTDGLSGNEDAGQMSAWYVLSSMGIYQVEPAGGRFFFGSPIWDKAEISLPEGRSFTIEAPNNSSENKYIQRIYLNGRPYTKNYIDYADIISGGTLTLEMGSEHSLWYCADEPEEYISQRPEPSERLLSNKSVEQCISEVSEKLSNKRLAWMFANCFPNTLETTVHYRSDDGEGHPDTFVYTGDIHAMWLRDSGAQVWPYLRFASTDEQIRSMIEGVIRRQFKCICIDPYANAFNIGPTGTGWMSDNTLMDPNDHERKWEIDSHCYPIRLAYEYWKKTGDTSVFDESWINAMQNILSVLREQQRKDGLGSYYFTRECDRQYDMKCNLGYGNPIKPCGLIVSAFRPSDDATVLDFLVPSNFFAVTSLRKAAEILETVNQNAELATSCRELADEVEAALKEYAVYDHPKYGKIYAFEVDGFGNHLLMDDANVPSLLALPYLGDVPADDPIYQNTRRFVLSEDNPYRFSGAAGMGIGGPHIGYDYIWPMSIMMRAFTSNDDKEIQDCIIQLMTSDAGTGFMHESYQVDDPSDYTRSWFAWQNANFGDLILKLIDDGKLDLLNQII